MFTYKLLALVGMLADSTFIFLPLWTHFDLVIIYLLFSAPATFERQFQRELPLLYKYLTEAPSGKVFLKLLCSNFFIFFWNKRHQFFFSNHLVSMQVCWKDVIHWMWPLFTENWGSWRDEDLHLSPCPFTVSCLFFLFQFI